MTAEEDPRAAARALGAELGIGAALAAYQAHAWRGTPGGHPTLHLDDVSAIPFLVDIAGVEEYQHRGRLRAGNGDVYVTVTPAAPGYEDYCRSTLRLGAPEHLVADPVGAPIAVAEACTKGPVRIRLAEIARQAGGLSIHPYMGIEAVWELARMLATDSGSEVRVLAPPPPVTWIANDKAVFDELVTRVVGRDALVETRIEHRPRDIAKALSKMAKRHNRVGLKRTRCASAMGNAVLDASEVQTDETAMSATRAFLSRTEWPEGEAVLVVAWLDTDLSPSTQLWIPPRGHGDVRLDGIYEQILSGEEKVFVGSRPSRLPERVERELARTAMLVATALQELGYVGRCSFDHVVTGDLDGDFKACFTECNGRWGGTSAPMSLLDRISSGARPPYRAQDVVFPSLVGATFRDVLNATAGDLYQADTGTGRFIYYNVGPLHEHGKFDVISIGTNDADAEEGVLRRLPASLGA